VLFLRKIWIVSLLIWMIRPRATVLLQNVVTVVEQTGTLWENYAPEKAAPGNPGKPDFVGWTGLSTVAMLFEYVLGLRANVPGNRLVWDI
jgi:hypothetical protein